LDGSRVPAPDARCRRCIRRWRPDPPDLLGREGNHVRVGLGEREPGKGEVPALSLQAISAREAREALAHRCAQRCEARGLGDLRP
jgi:hypothetical protein